MHNTQPPQIYFAERAYLEPTTKIGPSPDEIISPVILAFDPVSDDDDDDDDDDDEAEEEEAEAPPAAAVRLRGPGRTGSSGGIITREAR